jgi:hypothetical protein
VSTAAILKSGGALIGSQLSDLLRARLCMPDVALRGYVLDNLPPKDFDPRVLLKIEHVPPSFVIEIHTDEDEAIAKVSKFGLDLETGMLYSEADLTPGEHQPLVQVQNPDDANAGPLLNEDGTPLLVCLCVHVCVYIYIYIYIYIHVCVYIYTHT